MTASQSSAAQAKGLAPAMPPSIEPNWPGAIWVGEVDEQTPRYGTIALLGAESYATARLLIRHRGSAPRGFVEVPISDSAVDADDLTAAIGQLPPVPAESDGFASVGTPPISVIICTRNRPGQLADVLSSLAELDYPDYEVVIVDNDPSSGLTPPVVQQHHLPGLRVVQAPVPGLARARNVGLAAVRHEIVAFTDDDVLVDADWLSGIAHGFGAGRAVGCVTGLVASGEINSLPQWYFDRRVSWARNCSPTRYSMADKPSDDPMFPFQVGAFGTGANFAARRSVLFDLGGFDEGFGAGSPTGGGEDIDLFVRMLLAGHVLNYEPRALIWHRHRSDLAALATQSHDYGRGLAAWLTKLVLNPRTAAKLLPRARSGLRHLRSINDMPLAAEESSVLGGLGAVERRGMLAGPFAFARARIGGGRARPLAGCTPSASTVGGVVNA